MGVAVKEPRYPIPFYSEGWFQIAWTKDLPPGQLRKVHQFGTDYVLFRAHNGELALLGDVCPHLGAHFSEGGTVVGNSIRCPYHNWEFGTDGVCSNIPYSDSIPVKARTPALTVVERYGMIFMYRNKAGTPPTYDLPEIEDFDEDSYTKPATYEFTVRIHGQDIMENSVDSPHFAAVHGHDMPVNSFKSEGEELRITQDTGVNFLGIHLKARLEFHMIEPGFHYLHFPEVPGPPAHVFSSIVPIDEEHVSHRLTFRVKRSRIPFMSAIARKFLIWRMMVTYREDMRIWQSKDYQKHPVLCDGDGSIMKLRRWYAQFYDPCEVEPARRLDVVGQ